MKLYRKGIVFLTLVLLLGMCTISSIGNYIEHHDKINIGNILELDITPSSSFWSRPNEVGRYTSIDLDSNGYPYISYCDTGNGDLKYANWTGSNWNIETVDTSGDVGYTTSLELDSNENPHISYYDYSNRDLKYASWNGNNWDIQIVDSTGDTGALVSLALDSNGYPHISYLDVSNLDLKYASWTGSMWDIEIVDSTGSVGGFTSLALDSNGYPHISYYDYGNNDVKYSSWTGSSWNIETVDNGRPGTGNAIALDSNDYPHISYYDTNFDDLKYARWTGSIWEKETVDSDTGRTNLGPASSLVLDSRDYPCISYLDMFYGDLKYARWKGSSWDIDIIDSEGVVGYFPSIVLDINDNPHISYFDWGNRNLKYATMNIGGWDTQNVDLAECLNLLDQQNNQFFGTGYGTGTIITAWAQSFTPTIESLIRVELPFFRQGNPIGLKISIRSDLSGEDLVSDYISASEVSDEETFWYGFDFPELILNIDQFYYIVWEPEGISSGNNLYWTFNYNNPYDDGFSWAYEVGNWDLFEPVGYDELDFLFKIYGSNDPPNTPTIDGPEEGKAGEEQEYIINTTDPDGDDVFYLIDWGNNSEESWDGPHGSGEEITLTHTWDEEGTYTVTVKAKDIHGFESGYVSLEVTMPKNKAINFPFLRFLENHPRLFPLLRQILGI